MKTKRQRAPISQTEVLNWLVFNHPRLHLDAEVERDWVWISTNLAGPDNKATRESIKEFGFAWAKRGHALPSGKTGTWSHACMKPIPFRRKGKAAGGNPRVNGEQETDSSISEDLKREALAFLNS